MARFIANLPLHEHIGVEAVSLVEEGVGGSCEDGLARDEGPVPDQLTQTWARDPPLLQRVREVRSLRHGRFFVSCFTQRICIPLRPNQWGAVSVSELGHGKALGHRLRSDLSGSCRISPERSEPRAWRVEHARPSSALRAFNLSEALRAFNVFDKSIQSKGSGVESTTPCVVGFPGALLDTKKGAWNVAKLWMTFQFWGVAGERKDWQEEEEAEREASDLASCATR